jgi:hypothetical protein
VALIILSLVPGGERPHTGLPGQIAAAVLGPPTAKARFGLVGCSHYWRSCWKWHSIRYYVVALNLSTLPRALLERASACCRCRSWIAFALMLKYGRPLQITYGYVSDAMRRGGPVDVPAILARALTRNSTGAVIVSTRHPVRMALYPALAAEARQ